MAAVRRRIKVPQSSPVEVKRAFAEIDRAFSDFTLETRTLNTTAPLAGGGNLTADRTFTLGYDSTLVLSGANLSRAALTGDVVAAAGSNATLMSDAISDRIPSLATITKEAEGTPGADDIRFTIQLQDGQGNNLLATAVLDVWVGTADLGAPAGVQTVTVTQGTQLAALSANQYVRVMTDANGLAKVLVNVAGAGTRYLMVGVGAQVKSLLGTWA